MGASILGHVLSTPSMGLKTVSYPVSIASLAMFEAGSVVVRVSAMSLSECSESRDVIISCLTNRDGVVVRAYVESCQHTAFSQIIGASTSAGCTKSTMLSALTTALLRNLISYSFS